MWHWIRIHPIVRSHMVGVDFCLCDYPNDPLGKKNSNNNWWCAMVGPTKTWPNDILWRNVPIKHNGCPSFTVYCPSEGRTQRHLKSTSHCGYGVKSVNFCFVLWAVASCTAACSLVEEFIMWWNFYKKKNLKGILTFWWTSLARAWNSSEKFQITFNRGYLGLY